MGEIINQRADRWELEEDLPVKHKVWLVHTQTEKESEREVGWLGGL